MKTVSKDLPVENIVFTTNIHLSVQISKVQFCKSLYIFMTNSLHKNQEVEFLQNKSDLAI